MVETFPKPKIQLPTLPKEEEWIDVRLQDIEMLDTGGDIVLKLNIIRYPTQMHVRPRMLGSFHRSPYLMDEEIRQTGHVLVETGIAPDSRLLTRLEHETFQVLERDVSWDEGG